MRKTLSLIILGASLILGIIKGLEHLLFRPKIETRRVEILKEVVPVRQHRR